MTASAHTHTPHTAALTDQSLHELVLEDITVELVRGEHRVALHVHQQPALPPLGLGARLHEGALVEELERRGEERADAGVGCRVVCLWVGDED
jgi:hypothetical protein